MPAVLILDVPDTVLAGIDVRAARLGLARNAYIRRRLAADAAAVAAPVSVADLHAFADRYADLDDRDAMRGAWR